MPDKAGDLIPEAVQRLAMKLSANALFLQQGFPMLVLQQQWGELRDALTEALELDLPPHLTLAITQPLPDPLMEILADGFVAPDDLSDLDEGWE